MGRRPLPLAAAGACALVVVLTLTGDGGSVPAALTGTGLGDSVRVGGSGSRDGAAGRWGDSGSDLTDVRRDAASRSGGRPVVPDAAVGDAGVGDGRGAADRFPGDGRPPAWTRAPGAPDPAAAPPPATGEPSPGSGAPADGAEDSAGGTTGASGSGAGAPAPGSGAPSTPAPAPAPAPQPPATTPPPAPSPAPGSGRPGPDTTGVPDGVALRVHEGDLRITTPGAVVEGLEIRGFVEVRAPDVTLRHVVVRGRPIDSPRGLVSVTVEGASVTIERSELAPTTPSPWIDGVRGWGITARGVDIHHVIDGFHLYGDDVLIESSWVHDHVHFENDPHQGGSPSHDDSVQIQRGSNIRIVGNVMSGAYNTGIQFTQDMGTVSDVVISGNLLGGGGCTINLAEKGRGPFQGVVVRDNRFLLDTRVPRCAIIAPSTTVVAASGNTFTDGSVARVRSGD